MTIITLEIPPELEQRLRDEAAKQGINPDRYILNALQESLQSSSAASQIRNEADLLQQVNTGLAAEEWEQYHALIAKRRSETLTLQEQAKLVEISNQIEQANVQRIQSLIELSQLRGRSLEETMQDLGIQAAINA